MKIKNLVIISALACFVSASAQVQKADTLTSRFEKRVTSLENSASAARKLRISGYIQAQWETTQSEGTLRVGEARNPLTENNQSINRFGVRRGRLKTTYEDFGCLGVFEMDLNERSISLKDVYLQVADPWTKVFALTGGVFNRPFGYEINYSTARLETPERSRIITVLFPDERDLGAMLTVQAPATSAWNGLKLDAGLFSGNGVQRDNDSKKDFIGHLGYNASIGENIRYGLGASMYYGFIAQQNRNVYSMRGNVFAPDSTASNAGQYARRVYSGFDAQLSLTSSLGLTLVRGEYLFGQQPGAQLVSRSPNGSVYTNEGDTYVRNFAGGYIQVAHDFGTTKHSVVLKYDWYDPNSGVSQSQIGAGGSFTGVGDIAYYTLGMGYHYRLNANVKLVAFYEIIQNDITASLAEFNHDRNDNILTLRVQYRF